MRAIALPSLEPLVTFEGEVFRNIYTIIESQNLFDDLGLSEEETLTLFSWDNASSQINHDDPQKNRVFQYHDPSTSSMAVFADGTRPTPSRFSDGSFGVWYGALDAETSTRETLYHCLVFAQEEIRKTNDPVINERVMFLANIASKRSADMLDSIEVFPDLIHPTDYTLCQTIGAACRVQGVELLRTLSARKSDGVCVPVFTPNAIKAEKKIYYLRYTFTRDGEAIVTTINDRVIKIPTEWGLRR